ncbi:MAG: thrombospondin type 3 repeat-containing protein, partial [Verrucomicrobiota bacterium]
QFGQYGQVSDPTKADTDNDRMNDLEEAVAGTDPNVAGSFFQCLEISARNLPMFGKTLRWNASTGRFYSIYASSNLLTSEFQPLISDLPAAPPENTWTDTVSGVELLYYRIGVRRP